MRKIISLIFKLFSLISIYICSAIILVLYYLNTTTDNDINIFFHMVIYFLTLMCFIVVGHGFEYLSWKFKYKIEYSINVDEKINNKLTTIRINTIIDLLLSFALLFIITIIS